MDRLIDALDSFRCYKDTDIESFLRNDALEYLKRKWCSIYLIVDEDAFDAGTIKIEAYFTLSHKTLIPTQVSKTKLKDASGFKTSETVHFVLIGQLGKYIAYTPAGQMDSAAISGQEILNYAFEIIHASNVLIPCRCVLVECSEDLKVQQVYTTYGFTFFQFDGEHYQFYKRI